MVAKFAVALCSLLLTAPAASALAQSDIPTVPPNTRVRVFAPTFGNTPSIVGSLLRSDSLSVVVRSGNGMVWTVPLSGITTVEVSRGRLGAGGAALKGAGLGLLIGGVSGTAWGALAHASGSVAGDAALGAAAGALTGALFGALLIHERWETLSAVPRIGLAPRSGKHEGAALSVAITRAF